MNIFLGIIKSMYNYILLSQKFILWFMSEVV